MLSNSQEGLTALILAIKQGHIEVVQELVLHGRADVNIHEKVTICYSFKDMVAEKLYLVVGQLFM